MTEEIIRSPEMPLDDNDHNYSKEKLKLLVPRKPERSKPSHQKKEKAKRLSSQLEEILRGTERVKESEGGLRRTVVTSDGCHRGEHSGSES